MNLLALAPVLTSLSVILESPFLSRVEALLDSVLSGLFFSFLFSPTLSVRARIAGLILESPFSGGIWARERERARGGRRETERRESARAILAEEDEVGKKNYQKISVSLSALISVSF